MYVQNALTLVPGKPVQPNTICTNMRSIHPRRN